MTQGYVPDVEHKHRPNRALAVICLLVLLIPLALYRPAHSASPAIHPSLLQLAHDHPDQRISVIIQKQFGSSGVEEWVIQSGGVIIQDLSLINALAAEMPASAAVELGRLPGVRWVSPDAPVAQSGEMVSVDELASAFVQTIGADRLWNGSPPLRGQGVTVAIVDSGISPHPDLTRASRNSRSRIIASADFSRDRSRSRARDWYGHGTHVAGTIGGNGLLSLGAHIGVAPEVNLVNVRVCDSEGQGTTSDVVAGLQWVYEHKDEYGIRVVNLSLNSSLPESYHTSPLDAALEVLWFNGIVVVVSAGNNGHGADNGILYPPANDPFVITVGALDDRGTADLEDDLVASFSAGGRTTDGLLKPDIVAPGSQIVSLLANGFSRLSAQHPDHRVAGVTERFRPYFRMSGTSMASAVTAGAVALLLQDEPSLTPDQVKFRLLSTARPLGSNQAGAGCIDIHAAVFSETTESANTGGEASQLLWTGDDPAVWDSVNWNSVNWNNVNWNSVNWNSVNWNSVNWNSVIWDD